MPDLPISGLPVASIVYPADLTAIVQAGTTKKATVAQLLPPREDVSVLTGEGAQLVQKRATSTIILDSTTTPATWIDVPGTSHTIVLAEAGPVLLTVNLRILETLTEFTGEFIVEA